MAGAKAVPVIGVVAHRIAVSGRASPVDGQYGDYCASVIRAGGAPLVVPVGLGAEARRAVASRLDGLLLPGGVDVAPWRYGREPHPALREVDPELDEIELSLARAALEGGVPILAICRGIQLLTVAAGGTLIQDIPALVPGALDHAVRDRTEAHDVRVEAGTRLAAALGVTACRVNSRHHQAVERAAPGMVVTARAPDGIVEAVERVAGPFVVGVQWHPENLTAASEPMRGLFRAFVEACGS